MGGVVVTAPNATRKIGSVVVYDQDMSKRQRAIFSALIAFGIVMLVVAAMSGAGDGSDITVSGNPAIDALIPERESEVLRRTEVGIDLAEGLMAALTLETSDGRNIPVPSDQLEGNFQDNLGRFVFRPGEGKVLDVFPPQSNCVTATFWPVTDRQAAQIIRWCFEAT